MGSKLSGTSVTFAREYEVIIEQKIAQASEGGRLPLEVESTQGDADTPTSIMGIHRLVYGKLERKLLHQVGQYYKK